MFKTKEENACAVCNGFITALPTLMNKEKDLPTASWSVLLATLQQ